MLTFDPGSIIPCHVDVLSVYRALEIADVVRPASEVSWLQMCKHDARHNWHARYGAGIRHDFSSELENS